MVFKLSISKKSPFLFFIGIILISIFFSGCINTEEEIFKAYEHVYISSVSVNSTPQQEGYLLTVTPFITNNDNSDSSMLYVKILVSAEDNIVGEKDIEIGYVKSKSFTSNSAYFNVFEPGMYRVIVQLFDDEDIIHQRDYNYEVTEKLSMEESADIKLTDMKLTISEFVNNSSDAAVMVSPGIYNQGGDSDSLSMIVTVVDNSYNVYSGSEEFGILEASGVARGNISFIIPRNAEYIFSVSVEENGREIVVSEVPEPIKLDIVEKNTTKTYPLVEEGTPPIEETEETEEQPGFQILVALSSSFLASRKMKRRLLNDKKNG